MRALTIIFFSFCTLALSPSLVKAQDTEVPDTIIMLTGKKLLVNVSGLTSTDIKYFVTGVAKQQTVKRKSVQMIHYHTGRQEVLNKPLFTMISASDYRSIIITDKTEDVDGLFPRGKVESRSPKSVRSAKDAQKNAEIRLKKKAANLGGIMILLTRKEFKGGYGEVPTCIMEGVAYGTEPATEQSKESAPK
ncbi:MAG TPA: hypothetical protein VMV56_09435 [Williamwhitmania sp.]|nr:hypothetical protein [Williamwhitmania sp.]